MKNYWVDRSRRKYLNDCQVFLFCFTGGPLPFDPANTDKNFFGHQKLCRKPNWDLSKFAYPRVDGAGIFHQGSHPFDPFSILWFDYRQKPIVLPTKAFLTVDLSHVRINNILIGDWL